MHESLRLAATPYTDSLPRRWKFESADRIPKQNDVPGFLGEGHACARAEAEETV